MPIRILMHFTGRNMLKIPATLESEKQPSTVNAKPVADFTRVVEQTGMLDVAPAPDGQDRDGH